VRLTAFDAGPRRLVLALARDTSERSRHAALQKRLVEGIVRAQEEERQRISRELHDAIGQLLTALSVQVKAIESRPEAAPLRAELDHVRQVTEQAIAETSQLAHRLRPPALDDLGFVAALEGYVRSFSRVHGIATDVAVRGMSGGARLPPAVETALYRTAQEALTNVAKHAAAVTASVVIDRGPDRVRMVVDDDGRGFALDPETGLAKDGGGLGLAGMRERAQLLGGQVEVETRPGVGTTISLTLPLTEE
jgi:signal transduction histidine kinase